jgi:trimethylamine-N-oxide reductase (cytochrome c)
MAVLKTKDKSVVKTIGLMGGLGGSFAGVVDIKDGKIIRIRPLHYDWRWKREQIRLWEMKRNGKTLDPGWQELPSPYCLSYRKRVYSPNRVRYPLKREIGRASCRERVFRAV